VLCKLSKSQAYLMMPKSYSGTLYNNSKFIGWAFDIIDQLCFRRMDGEFPTVTLLYAFRNSDFDTSGVTPWKCLFLLSASEMILYATSSIDGDTMHRDRSGYGLGELCPEPADHGMSTQTRRMACRIAPSIWLDRPRGPSRGAKVCSDARSGPGSSPSALLLV
jgi:hypothetical protein